MCTRGGRRGPAGPPQPFWLPVWDLAAQGTSPGRGSLHNYGFIYTTSLPNAQEGGPPFSNGEVFGCFLPSSMRYSSGPRASDCALCEQKQHSYERRVLNIFRRITDLYCQRSPMREPLRAAVTDLPLTSYDALTVTAGYDSCVAPLPAPQRSTADRPRLPAGQHRTGHAFKPRAQASPATRVGDSAVKRTHRTAQSVRLGAHRARTRIHTNTH